MTLSCQVKYSRRIQRNTLVKQDCQPVSCMYVLCTVVWDPYSKSQVIIGRFCFMCLSPWHCGILLDGCMSVCDVHVHVYL